MVILEALNALAGDCLLLRYPGPDKKQRLWIIDGGPKADNKKGITVWSDVLVPRLQELKGDNDKPLPVALGMVSHIDDDHINGIQKLTSTLINATPGDPAVVKFSRFWFNSFEKMVGSKPAKGKAEPASLQSLAEELLPRVKDEHATLIMQSVGQGNMLAADLRTLKLQGNKPVGELVQARKGQKALNIEGAKVTVIGPLESRLVALRKEWEKALKKPGKKAREAALQELFLPEKKLDKSIPNLSSIVVLVEVGKKKLLLTGDAHGNDVVKAWKELGLGTKPVTIDLLKLPHHGSIRNVTEPLLSHFIATHYVFSADGKHDNPDAPAVEAVVKMHGDRPIVMHFTNADVTWKKTYKLEKGGKTVRTLEQLIDALHDAYPGPWDAKFRDPDQHSIMVKL